MKQARPDHLHKTRGNGKFYPNRINPKDPMKLQPLPEHYSNVQTTTFTGAHQIKGDAYYENKTRRAMAKSLKREERRAQAEAPWIVSGSKRSTERRLVDL